MTEDEEEEEFIDVTGVEETEDEEEELIDDVVGGLEKVLSL